MPRQYSPEFRDRALRLLDTTMGASKVSEFGAIKSASSKLGISEKSLGRWRRKPKSMPGSGPGRPARTIPRSAASSVKSLTCAEPTRF